jgi:hypothetical protein
MLSAESPNEIDKICLSNHPNPSSKSTLFSSINILALLPLHMQTAVMHLSPHCTGNLNMGCHLHANAWQEAADR